MPASKPFELDWGASVWSNLRERGGKFWFFVEDEISPNRPLLEKAFELGYVRTESWKWLDKTVIQYRLTKAGRKELTRYRRQVDRKFKRIFERMNNGGI